MKSNYLISQVLDFPVTYYPGIGGSGVLLWDHLTKFLTTFNEMVSNGRDLSRLSRPSSCDVPFMTWEGQRIIGRLRRWMRGTRPGLLKEKNRNSKKRSRSWQAMRQVHLVFIEVRAWKSTFSFRRRYFKCLRKRYSCKNNIGDGKLFYICWIVRRGKLLGS